MRITISGPPGSGKTTACSKLSEALGLEAVVFGKIFRELAAERNLTLGQLGAIAEEDPSIDRMIDSRILEIARSHPDVILESRLSAYMLYPVCASPLSSEPRPVVPLMASCAMLPISPSTLITLLNPCCLRAACSCSSWL